MSITRGQKFYCDSQQTSYHVYLLLLLLLLLSMQGTCGLCVCSVYGNISGIVCLKNKRANFSHSPGNLIILIGNKNIDKMFVGQKCKTTLFNLFPEGLTVWCRPFKFLPSKIFRRISGFQASGCLSVRVPVLFWPIL